ncbi:hypothetical protein [Bacteroides sp.]
MNKFYKLDYKHPTRAGLEEISIGFFSSYDVIDKVIQDRMNKPGFKDYPRSCFVITEVIVDDFGWKNGFAKTEKGDVEIK